MSPKEYADPEDEPQTSEEVEEVSEGEAGGVQDQEQDGDNTGTEARPMTMEERKAKMQQLRVKLVRRVFSLSHKCRFLTTVKPTAVIYAREPCLFDRRIFKVQNCCARPCTAREAAQTRRDAPGESGCGRTRRGRREAEELGVDH